VPIEEEEEEEEKEEEDKRVRNKATYLTRLFTWTSSRDLVWLYKNSVFPKWVIFPS
jgi:hypothetical protein